MHIALVGTYPPRRCGIATFTADVESSLTANGSDVCVLAVDPDAPASWYREQADLLDRMRPDAALIQHEFGIYGPHAGARLLELTDRLTVPFVLTLHTVLPAFADDQASVLRRACRRAEAVTVFTETARRLVVEQQMAGARQVHVIAHGAPVELGRSYDRAHALAHLGLPAEARVMSTFGLLSAGKGIELGIAALAELVSTHPEMRYVIAGRTHPEVARRDGEHYRAGLMRLAHRLGVRDRVVFVDRFLDVTEIASLLSVTDVFCTPYRGEDQSVSGALTFALAAGVPVASTPYRYALDVLGDGAGMVVPFDDHLAFANAIDRLATAGLTRTHALAAAAAAAEGLAWPTIAQVTTELLADVARRGQHLRPVHAGRTLAGQTHPPARRHSTALVRVADQPEERTGALAG
jgi:glycosyltransferase involved in cell wall biosynthesis